MTRPTSPFDRKGKPSELAKDHAFNGINHTKSLRATAKPKTDPLSFPGGNKELAPTWLVRKKDV